MLFDQKLVFYSDNIISITRCVRSRGGSGDVEFSAIILLMIGSYVTIQYEVPVIIF